MARKVNDYTADLVARWPERFGNFATLPVPDAEGALAEVSYALDMLGAQGVVLYSNYGDRYLGDPSFEPLWAELDRRQAIIFIHPTHTTLPELEGIPAPFVDFPFATSRTAVYMVLKGVLKSPQETFSRCYFDTALIQPVHDPQPDGIRRPVPHPVRQRLPLRARRTGGAVHCHFRRQYRPVRLSTCRH